MAKVWASEPGEHRAGTFRAAHEEAAGEQQRTGAASAPAPDAEMLDIVRRFEKGYAELAPGAEWPQRQPAGGDELFPEFANIFEDPPPAKAAPAESARVVAMPRREVEPVAPAPAPSSSAASPFLSRTREPAADVDLDEAMAILRASERRAHPAPQPGADDEPEAPAPAFKAAPPELRPRGPDASVRREPDAADSATPATDWSSKAHTARTLAMIAAVVALAVGVVGGYFLAGGPAAKSPFGVIESSKQGGTQLRLERNLPQR